MRKRKLKICIICDIRSIHYKRWIRDIKSLGHDVTVFSIWKEEQEANKQVELITTPRIPVPMFKSLKDIIKMFYRIKISKHIQKKIRVLRPDIVHAHFLTDSGWIGAWTNFHPFIVTVHGSDALIHPAKLFYYKWGNSYVVKKADKVIIVANHLRNPIIQLGCTNKKIQFVPNYADDKFLISEREIEHKFDSVQLKPKIISARRLDPIYSLETLIKAAKHVIKHYPNAEFNIIDEGSEFKYLKSLTKKLGLIKHIKFRGKISHDELVQYMKTAHLYISTALSDGLAVSTLEGIASGSIPILTDIPANRALFNDGLIGELFPCKNHIQLSEKLVNLIDESDQLYKISVQNIAFIKSRFTKNNVLNMMESIYYDS